jgi:hypothetical protein
MSACRYLILALAVCASACGAKIGDSCKISSDCSQEGGRLCDELQPDGYCTISGCDVGSCPSEAECVQFFSSVRDEACKDDHDCTLAEICTVGGYCAERITEVRFCMLRCDGHGDCRDGYECRDLARMGAHGGQPVPREGQLPEDLPKYCAATLPCQDDSDCDLEDRCNTSRRRCEPH